MEQFNIYKDMKERTNGEFHLGIVGPVRTGKSTFIRKFMELLVLPKMEQYEREQAMDEMPISGKGKTITTVEPKFIPKKGVNISFVAGTNEKEAPNQKDEIQFHVRMIDCVGYMVNGAEGHSEDQKERLVKTPWYEYEIPFSKAAEIGTKKVIKDHSTIGIVITTDGSFGEIGRENYVIPEGKIINELKSIHKPFVVVLNTIRPYSKEAKKLAKEMEQNYQVTVIPVNCEELKKEDVDQLLKSILLEFPVSYIEYHMPSWLENLPNDHWLKSKVIEKAKEILVKVNRIKDIYELQNLENQWIHKIKLDNIQMSNGVVRFAFEFLEEFYYKVLSELIGLEIQNEYQFIQTIRELATMKKEYDSVSAALTTVRQKGYSVVVPNKEQIVLKEPELMKHGNKYGVKIKADAPSIHMLYANISTEIAPIVGTEEQAKDLLHYMKQDESGDTSQMWNVNIFGKTLEQLVEEGIEGKATKMTEESQRKLQETLEKVMNDSNGGLVCIII